MANPLQQAAVTRKITYLVVIAGLFTVSLFVRGKFSLPGAVERKTIARQAENLDLRELDLGDAELAGSAIRLSLTGMRGVVTTAMWRTAIEKQKRHEFQEMEDVVRIVSRLQPHFITPWIFQGWNMSYNVSVENERLNDMYFYIARGLEFMAEGERLNTKAVDKGKETEHKIGSPDLRYQIGFFYQNKFTVSDKVTTLRSLFQLSCIPPTERDPRAYRTGDDKEVDAVAFKKFCGDYPQFVRRLREKLDCRKPEDVVDFLKMNAKVPSRFKPDRDVLADPADQFPVLPDAYKERPNEYNPTMAIPGDVFDGVLAARAWFGYAQTTLPPNPKGLNGKPIASGVLELKEEDLFKYRIPRSPALIIFRQSPCRAQSYVAERLMKEGWFDKDTTWRPDEMRDAGSFWFKRTEVEPDPEFRGTDNAQDQWDMAYKMWSDHGRETGMTVSVDERLYLEDMAKAVPPDDQFSVMPLEQMVHQFKFDPEAAEARKTLLNLDKNKSVTNFDFFLEQARALASPSGVAANKLIWQAKRLDTFGHPLEATELYALGLAEWRKVLEQFEKFHRTDRSDQTESDVYELVMRLTDLVQQQRTQRELAVKSQVETAAIAFIGGVLGDYRVSRHDLDRMTAPAAQWAMTAAFGGPLGSACGTDLSRGLAERDALGLIVALEPATQAAARDVTDVAIPAVASGLARAFDAFDPPAAVVTRHAALARAANLFGFEYRTDYKQRPTERERSDFLRWSRPYVEEEVKARLGILHKLPPDITTDPNEPR